MGVTRFTFNSQHPIIILYNIEQIHDSASIFKQIKAGTGSQRLSNHKHSLKILKIFRKGQINFSNLS